MNHRIKKKIVSHPQHPRHTALVAHFVKRMEDYARRECIRLGLDPEEWGEQTLRWTRRVTRYLVLARYAPNEPK